MLGLGLPERPAGLTSVTTLPGQRPDASTSAIVSSATRFCSSSSVEDRRAVARAAVVALAVQGRRIVDLEEELEQVAVGGLLRVEDDLDRFGVVPWLR